MCHSLVQFALGAWEITVVSGDEVSRLPTDPPSCWRLKSMIAHALMYIAFALSDGNGVGMAMAIDGASKRIPQARTDSLRLIEC